MPTLLEAGFEVLYLLLLLRILQALLGVFGLIEGGVHIHSTHVVNTVLTLRLEVSDKETPLQLLLVLRRGPFEFVLTPCTM